MLFSFLSLARSLSSWASFFGWRRSPALCGGNLSKRSPSREPSTSGGGGLGIQEQWIEKEWQRAGGRETTIGLQLARLAAGWLDGRPGAKLSELIVSTCSSCFCGCARPVCLAQCGQPRASTRSQARALQQVRVSCLLAGRHCKCTSVLAS